MQRAPHHVLHRADFGDAAGIHHSDPIAGLGDHTHVVSHQHHRGAVIAPEAFDQGNDLRLHGDIKRGGRLIRDDQFGLGANRERDDDALTHAAGEFMRIGVDAFFGRGNADFGKQIDRALACRGSRKIEVRGDGFHQLIADAIERIEAGQRVLEDHADAFSPNASQLFRRERVDPQTRQRNFTAGNTARPIDQADDRQTGNGFAGAGFADHAQHFTARDLKGNAVDRAQHAAAGGKFHLQIAYREHGFRHAK